MEKGACTQVVTRKKCSRSQLLVYTANLPSTLIGMEAGVGSRFLGRALRETRARRAPDSRTVDPRVAQKGSHFQVVFRRLLPRLGYQSAIWAVPIGFVA
jgi:hypothetical protein